MTTRNLQYLIEKQRYSDNKIEVKLNQKETRTISENLFQGNPKSFCKWIEKDMSKEKN